MKIAYAWLKEFLQTDWSAEKTAELLTELGLEVESIDTFESVKGALEGIVVGEVLTCEQHPNADKLRLTTVNLGDGKPVQIVCGAPNVAKGQKVPVATIGTTLYDENGKAFPIKKSKIRGQESYGMICAEDELGLGSDHEGILVLNNNLKPGTKASEVFNIVSDKVFEIGLTPNRADAMSHYGVARDLRAGLMQKNIKLQLLTPSVMDFNVDDTTFTIPIDVEDSKLVPRYTGLTISDITIKESPQWLKNRLKSIGINPKNNIVDITNYVLHDLGQPLHAFDADKIKGRKIKVKTLPEGTKFKTLDGIERTLQEDDIMICDAQSNPLCIGGVMGGISSGVTETTSNIFLESAYFNPVSIRKTSKYHAINSDASFRFERGIDISLTKYVLKRAAMLILELAGGKISSEIQECYPDKVEEFEVIVNYNNVNSMIGQEIPKDTIKKILASLDIKVQSETDQIIGLKVPSYRVDVTREADVIEEILRVYGYNNIDFNEKLNTSLFYTGFDKEKYLNVLSNQLVALGFNETMSNSLTKPEYANFSNKLKEEHNVLMLNPLSSDLESMRQSMLFSTLENIGYNLNRQNDSTKFFEWGKTYHNYPDGYSEHLHLALAVSGNNISEHWQMGNQKSDFFYLKGILKTLFDKVGLQNVLSKPIKNDLFSEGLTFSINNHDIAELGLVNEKLLKSFGIKQSVIYADIKAQSIFDYAEDYTMTVKELPKFPSVKRDLALLVNRDTTFEALYNTSFNAEKKFLKTVDLFDVYEGKNLPENKKSYALSFILRDDSKTLNDKLIEKTMKHILKALENEHQVVLRT